MLRKYTFALVISYLICGALSVSANDYRPSLKYYNKLKTCTEYREDDKGAVKVRNTITVVVGPSIHGIGKKGSYMDMDGKRIPEGGRCIFTEDHIYYRVRCALPMDIAKKYAQEGITMRKYNNRNSSYIKNIHSNTKYCFKEHSNL